MSEFFKQVHWKVLLAIFKVKRIVSRIYSVRRLDFSKKELFIKTTTVREYYTRARSCDKEPETCAWVEHISEGGGVLYDVGANVGAYSLVAGALGMRVFSFEPSPENYTTLHTNVRMNKLEDSVTPLPLTLGITSGVVRYPLPDTTSGATASFGGNQAATGGISLVSMSIDSVIKELDVPRPYAIKIDVDGAEVDILHGAQETLSGSTLKHLLIEVNLGCDDSVKAILTKNGFEEVSRHKHGSGAYNVIFKRS